MLKGERVTLRPIKRADLTLFLAWGNDMEVITGSGSYLPLTEAIVEKYIEGRSGADNEEVNVMIDIVEGDEVRSIGSIGLHDIDWRNARANFGITIGEKDCWGKGYGAEATRLLLRYGFEQLNLNRVSSWVYDFNERSLRLHRRAGFIEEGRKRKAWFSGGVFCDEVMFGMLKEDWENTNAER